MSEKAQLMGEFTEKDLRHFRRVAFIAVAISTVTMLSCVVLLPLTYQYIQRIHSSMTSDVEFCRSRNRDLWSEVVTVQLGKGQTERADRFRREATGNNNGRWLFGHFVQTHDSRESALSAQRQYVASHEIRRQQPYAEARSENAAGGYDAPVVSKPDAATPAASSPNTPGYGPEAPAQPTVVQCECACQVGPAGPPGDAGTDGAPGKDGQPGEDGQPGKDAPRDALQQPCARECPTGPPGPTGPVGDKGPRGYPGDRGVPGPAGKPAIKGSPGKQGNAGPPGNPGRPGDKGLPGKHIPGTAPPGPPGIPGPMGPPGPPGVPGQPGKVGSLGEKGEKGARGNSGPYGKPGGPGPVGPAGNKGALGDCSSCPPPRTPPGY